MAGIYKKLSTDELIKIINHVQENLESNLIGKGRIRNGMKGSKGLIIVKNNQTKVYEHSTPDAKREDFYGELNWMLSNKKFSKNYSIIRAYRGIDEKFADDVSKEIFGLHNKYPFKYKYLADLTEKDDNIISRLDFLFAEDPDFIIIK